jgi:hypothetical protein
MLRPYFFSVGSVLYARKTKPGAITGLRVGEIGRKWPSTLRATTYFPFLGT